MAIALGMMIAAAFFCFLGAEELLLVKPRAGVTSFYEKMAQKRNEILNGPLLDCFNLIQSLHDDLMPPTSE